MTIDLAKCIRYLRPNDEWTLVGNDYANLVWLSPTSKPTEDDLVTVWSVIEPSLQWDPIREQRNSLLCASDWTQFNDVNLPNKQEWATYRQKLRDVTKDFLSPQDVIWPVPPA